MGGGGFVLMKACIPCKQEITILGDKRAAYQNIRKLQVYNFISKIVNH